MTRVCDAFIACSMRVEVYQEAADCSFGELYTAVPIDMDQVITTQTYVRVVGRCRRAVCAHFPFFSQTCSTTAPLFIAVDVACLSLF